MSTDIILGTEAVEIVASSIKLNDGSENKPTIILRAGKGGVEIVAAEGDVVGGGLEGRYVMVQGLMGKTVSISPKTEIPRTPQPGRAHPPGHLTALEATAVLVETATGTDRLPDPFRDDASGFGDPRDRSLPDGRPGPGADAGDRFNPRAGDIRDPGSPVNQSYYETTLEVGEKFDHVHIKDLSLGEKIPSLLDKIAELEERIKVVETR